MARRQLSLLLANNEILTVIHELWPIVTICRYKEMLWWQVCVAMEIRIGFYKKGYCFHIMALSQLPMQCKTTLHSELQGQLYTLQFCNNWHISETMTIWAVTIYGHLIHSDAMTIWAVTTYGHLIHSDTVTIWAVTIYGHLIHSDVMTIWAVTMYGHLIHSNTMTIWAVTIYGNLIHSNTMTIWAVTIYGNLIHSNTDILSCHHIL